MYHFFRWSLLVCLLFVVGCGSGVTAKGKIVKDGKPFTVSDKGIIMMNLSKDDKTYPADVKFTQGTFDVKAPGGGGVPVGTYKVSIEAYDPYTGTPTKEKDLFKGAFKTGTLTAEVVNSSTDVVVDVSKK